MKKIFYLSLVCLAVLGAGCHSSSNDASNPPQATKRPGQTSVKIAGLGGIHLDMTGAEVEAVLKMKAQPAANDESIGYNVPAGKMKLFAITLNRKLPETSTALMDSNEVQPGISHWMLQNYTAGGIMIHSVKLVFKNDRLFLIEWKEQYEALSEAFEDKYGAPYNNITIIEPQCDNPTSKDTMASDDWEDGSHAIHLSKHVLHDINCDEKKPEIDCNVAVDSVYRVFLDDCLKRGDEWLRRHENVSDSTRKSVHSTI